MAPPPPERGGREAAEERTAGMILLALDAFLCAAVIALLFATMWRDGDAISTAASAFALLPTLVFALLAWRMAP